MQVGKNRKRRNGESKEAELMLSEVYVQGKLDKGMGLMQCLRKIADAATKFTFKLRHMIYNCWNVGANRGA